MENDIKNTLKILKEGGVILYPTDTIWGIGCDATNSDAVNRIYQIKRRRDSKSMIIIVDKYDRINQYVYKIPDIVPEIIKSSQKPITIIYPKAKNLAPNLINKDGSIGIRITDHEFCKRVIAAFNKPVVSTSANISGSPFPENFLDIKKEILNSVDHVVKHEQNVTTQNIPSGIIKVTEDNQIVIIRE